MSAAQKAREDATAERAFEDFVRGDLPGWLRFAFMLTGDAALAEDLVQQVLIKCHRRWADGLMHHPEAYVKRAITNQYVSWRRIRANVAHIPWPGEQPNRSPHDLTDGIVERDLVWRALARLPRKQRAALVLRFYEQIPDEESAEILGCTASTIRSLVARGLTRLRADRGLELADTHGNGQG